MNDRYQDYLGSLELVGAAPIVRARRLEEAGQRRSATLAALDHEPAAVRAMWEELSNRLADLQTRIARIGAENSIPMAPTPASPSSYTAQEMDQALAAVTEEARQARERLEWLVRARAQLVQARAVQVRVTAPVVVEQPAVAPPVAPAMPQPTSPPHPFRLGRGAIIGLLTGGGVLLVGSIAITIAVLGV